MSRVPVVRDEFSGGQLSGDVVSSEDVNKLFIFDRTSQMAFVRRPHHRRSINVSADEY